MQILLARILQCPEIEIYRELASVVADKDILINAAEIGVEGFLYGNLIFLEPFVDLSLEILVLQVLCLEFARLFFVFVHFFGLGWVWDLGWVIYLL